MKVAYPHLNQQNHNWLSHHFILIWVLFIFCCLLYANTLTHQFTLDDVLVLTGNKFVQNGDYWSILSKDTFAGFFSNSENGQLVPGGRYRPLTLIIFSTIWNITDDPMVFHAFNILTYALMVVVLYQLLLLLFENFLKKSDQNKLALLTTILFAIHPIHTEVVNNIKAMDDLLSLLLAFLAWKTLLSPIFKNIYMNAVTVMMLMFLALLSKESAVVMVPIIGLSFWFFKRQSLLKSIAAIVPMIIALSCYLLIRSAVINTNDAIRFVPELMNNPFLMWHENMWMALPLNEQIATIIYVLGMYLQKAFIPLTLSHDYYPYTVAVVDFSSLGVWVTILIHTVLIIYAIIGIFKQHIAAFALAIYFISLSLFANVFFNIGTWMAERFLFIPSLGICLLISWTYVQAINYFKPSSVGRRCTLFSFIFITLIAILTTWQRASDWHNNLTLFEADIAKSPNSAKLNNALGGELSKTSQLPTIKNTPLEKTQLNRALGYLDKAIKLHPTYAMPHLIKGNTLHYLGHNQLALKSYQRALELKPGYPAALENSEKVKLNMDILQQQTESEKKVETAIKVSQSGDHQKAINLFTEVIEKTPTPKILFFRGIAFAQSQQYELALSDFKAAEELSDPEDLQNMVRIWQALATTYQKLNMKHQSQHYEQKIKALNLKY